PGLTLGILAGAGGLEVCGVNITNVDVDSASSALEAMCVAIEGETKLQLARSLMAAALTQAAGGATFGGFALCDLVCQDPGASKDEISACIDVTGAFNGSGDKIPAPFGQGSADSDPCKMAKNTACTVIDPGSCANP